MGAGHHSAGGCRRLLARQIGRDVTVTSSSGTLFAAVHESGDVQVFGRRDDYTISALLRPASKKRQGTKSREVCRGSAAGAMGILPRVRAC
jgi:hypothetical protein